MSYEELSILCGRSMVRLPEKFEIDPHSWEGKGEPFHSQVQVHCPKLLKRNV